MPARLAIHIPTQAVAIRVLADGTDLTLGRSPDNDCVLTHDSVSRRHARIRNEGARWIVEDLGSKNGVRVDGTRVREAEACAASQWLAIGDVFCEFERVGPEAVAHLNARAAHRRQSSQLWIDRIATTDSVDKLMDTLLGGIVDIAECRRGFLLVMDNDGSLSVRACHAMDAADLGGIAFSGSRSAVDRSILERRAVYLSDHRDHDWLQDKASVIAPQHPTALMSEPAAAARRPPARCRLRGYRRSGQGIHRSRRRSARSICRPRRELALAAIEIDAKLARMESAFCRCRHAEPAVAGRRAGTWTDIAPRLATPPESGADDRRPHAFLPQHPAVGATVTGMLTMAELRPGDVVADRFRVMRLLGMGGMGVVYQAHDMELDVDVALKLLRPELASRPDAFERFRQELLLARQVSSPHVVRIHDLVRHGEVWLISMDFVPGQSLERLLDTKGHLPPEDAIRIVRQLALGLAAAHQRGVVHRDLKPANVLMTEDGEARITDFGVARSAGSTGITVSGVIIGTPEYLSPEQARADPVDGRSDLYALGLIFFEMLTGTLPFRGGTPAEMLAQRIVRDPPPPGHDQKRSAELRGTAVHAAARAQTFAPVPDRRRCRARDRPQARAQGRASAPSARHRSGDRARRARRRCLPNGACMRRPKSRHRSRRQCSMSRRCRCASKGSDAGDADCSRPASARSRPRRCSIRPDFAARIRGVSIAR